MHHHHFSNINLIELAAQILVNRFVDVLSGPERALYSALRNTGWVTIDKDSRIFLVPAADRLDFIRNITWYENEVDGRQVFEAFYRTFVFTMDLEAHTFVIRDQEGASEAGAARAVFHVMHYGALEWEDGQIDALETWPDDEWDAWERAVDNLYTQQNAVRPAEELDSNDQ